MTPNQQKRRDSGRLAAVRMQRVKEKQLLKALDSFGEEVQDAIQTQSVRPPGAKRPSPVVQRRK